jgi:hypothetical protein
MDSTCNRGKKNVVKVIITREAQKDLSILPQVFHKYADEGGMVYIINNVVFRVGLKTIVGHQKMQVNQQQDVGILASIASM